MCDWLDKEEYNADLINHFIVNAIEAMHMWLVYHASYEEGYHGSFMNILGNENAFDWRDDNHKRAAYEVFEDMSVTWCKQCYTLDCSGDNDSGELCERIFLTDIPLGSDTWDEVAEYALEVLSDAFSSAKNPHNLYSEWDSSIREMLDAYAAKFIKHVRMNGYVDEIPHMSESIANIFISTSNLYRMYTEQYPMWEWDVVAELNRLTVLWHGDEGDPMIRQYGEYGELVDEVRNLGMAEAFGQDVFEEWLETTGDNAQVDVRVACLSLFDAYENECNMFLAGDGFQEIKNLVLASDVKMIGRLW